MAEARSGAGTGSASDPASEAEALIERAWELRFGDMREVEALARRALELEPPPAMRVRAQATLAWVAHRAGRNEEAEDLLGGELAGDALPAGLAADPVAHYRLRVVQGMIAWHAGDHGRASLRYEQAGEHAERAGDVFGQASSRINLGVLAYHRGDYEEALERYLGALRLGQELDLDSLEVVCRVNIGLVALELGRPEEAEGHLEEALRKAGDRPRVDVFRYLARALDGLGRHDEAIEVARRGIEGASRDGDRVGAGLVRIEAGRALASAGRDAEAEAELGAAIEELGSGGAARHLAEARRELGVLLTRRGRLEEAVALLEEARAAAAAVEVRFEVEQAERARAAALHLLGRDREAYLALDRADRLARELRDEAAGQRAEVARVRYRLDAAQREREAAERRADELERLARELHAAQAEREALLARLELQAREDALTGLANRRALEERLEDERERVRRGAPGFALVLLDVDRFKEVNDRFGHEVGDAVLQEIGALLRDGLREVDLAARWGGEEFAIVMPFASDGGEPGDALSLARACASASERMRVAIEGHDWNRLAPGMAVTVSVGVATSREAATLKDLRVIADERLYRAKREGRDRVVASDPDRAGA